MSVVSEVRVVSLAPRYRLGVLLSLYVFFRMLVGFLASVVWPAQLFLFFVFFVAFLFSFFCLLRCVELNSTNFCVLGRLFRFRCIGRMSGGSTRGFVVSGFCPEYCGVLGTPAALPPFRRAWCRSAERRACLRQRAAVGFRAAAVNAAQGLLSIDNMYLPVPSPWNASLMCQVEEIEAEVLSQASGEKAAGEEEGEDEGNAPKSVWYQCTPRCSSVRNSL